MSDDDVKLKKDELDEDENITREENDIEGEEVSELDTLPEEIDNSDENEDMETDVADVTFNEEDEIQADTTDEVQSDAGDTSSWIKIVGGEFTCTECENTSAPETNTIEGTVTADLEQIKSDLEQYSTKVVYGICPVCGMEYVFKLKDSELYLEPSDLEK